MCELCGPRISRRTALALAGGVLATAISTNQLASATASVAVAPSGLEIEPRSRWAGDGRPALGPIESEDVRFLLVHHSASQIGADPIGVMRSIYDFHTGPEKGWIDVAYNFFIDQRGVVYEGRTGSLEGAVRPSATGGNQGFSQLVCLLGDFTDELPTDLAMNSLVATLSWLAERHGVDTAVGATTSFISRGSNLWPSGEQVLADTVSGHREMSRTACPGDAFYPVLKDEIRSRVATASPPPTPVSTAPDDARVPPVTRATIPPTTTTEPSPPTSAASVPSSEPDAATGSASATTSASTGSAAASSTVQEPVGDSTVNATSSSETSGRGVNVGLALVSGAAVVIGSAAVVKGARRSGRSGDDEPNPAQPDVDVGT